MNNFPQSAEPTQLSSFDGGPTESPGDERFARLAEALRDNADRWQTIRDWPGEALSACARCGVFPRLLSDAAGIGWPPRDQTLAYLKLAAADLTTTFIITQFIGACRRIAGSENRRPAEQYLDKLLRGEAFATVGISHLTTSRRHLGKPVLTAEPTAGGFRLSGMSPWVTGGAQADVLVLAATTADGLELLAAVPTDLPGLHAYPGAELTALSASCTDRVTLDNVHIDNDMVLAGPIEGVMSTGSGAATGGLQTSTLAVGLSIAAVDYLSLESERRKDLVPVARTLRAQTDQLEQQLLDAAEGGPCDTGELRGQANRLVLKTTQAALTAAKGAGFVQGHPVGRWCREALFFLVWSCPQPVAAAHLCELAGIDG